MASAVGFSQHVCGEGTVFSTAHWLFGLTLSDRGHRYISMGVDSHVVTLCHLLPVMFLCWFIVAGQLIWFCENKLQFNLIVNYWSQSVCLTHCLNCLQPKHLFTGLFPLCHLIKLNNTSSHFCFLFSSPFPFPLYLFFVFFFITFPLFHFSIFLSFSFAFCLLNLSHFYFSFMFSFSFLFFSFQTSNQPKLIFWPFLSPALWGFWIFFNWSGWETSLNQL